MGVENNECVIATTWDQKHARAMKLWIDLCDEKLRDLFAFVPSLVNHKTTIFLAPCGSKKGWEDDKVATRLRNEFIKQLQIFDSFEWVEVGYGEFGQKVLRGNCTNMYSDKEYEE